MNFHGSFTYDSPKLEKNTNIIYWMSGQTHYGSPIQWNTIQQEKGMNS